MGASQDLLGQVRTTEPCTTDRKTFGLQTQVLLLRLILFHEVLLLPLLTGLHLLLFVLTVVVRVEGSRKAVFLVFVSSVVSLVIFSEIAN